MKRDRFEELAGRGPARRPSDGGEFRDRDAGPVVARGIDRPTVDPRLLEGLRATLQAGVSPAWLARRLGRVIDGVADDCGPRADPRLLQGLQATRAGGMGDEELANRLGGLIDVITTNLK